MGGINTEPGIDDESGRRRKYRRLDDIGGRKLVSGYRNVGGEAGCRLPFFVLCNPFCFIRITEPAGSMMMACVAQKITSLSGIDMLGYISLLHNANNAKGNVKAGKPYIEGVGNLVLGLRSPSR